MIVKNYNSIIFDCDGVVLNSNTIKSRAFFKCALPYGQYLAKSFLDYHLKNGGISRYKKFDYFINFILPNNIDKPKLSTLLSRYEILIEDDLLNCEVSPYLKLLKNKMNKQKWYIVSGSNEKELNNLFKKKKIDHYFDGGVYGSPRDKIEIINSLLMNGLQKPSLFLGDSEYDFQVAKKSNLDFMFISEWTELNNWKDFCINNRIKVINNLGNLFN